MFMYWNGPVSTRCARTSRRSRSVVRSLTHDQIWPFSSGCMVNRKRTVSPRRSRTSSEEYSVNNSGQCSMSFVTSQTRSMGAATSTEFRVLPGMSGNLLEVVVDEGGDVGDGHVYGLHGDLDPIAPDD